MKRESDQKTQPLNVVTPSPKHDHIVILVVDDDPLIVDFLSDYLRGDGYDILTASSGEEAISKLKSSRVDIAFIDLKMPGMNGLETIERMARIERDTVTILMTGFPTLDSSVRAMKLGASDYVLKPFKLEELSSSLKKAIGERALRLEMKSLRKRISELEQSVSERKESIKINQKLEAATSQDIYSTRSILLRETDDENSVG